MQRDGGVIFSCLDEAFVYSDPESFMGCESAAEDSSGTRVVGSEVKVSIQHRAAGRCPVLRIQGFCQRINGGCTVPLEFIS